MSAGAIRPAPGSSRITRIVAETTTGQTPSGAAWEFVRNTGGAGLGVEQDTDQSAELPGDIVGLTDVDVIGENGTANYNFELSPDDAFDLVLESLLQAQFGDIDPGKLYAGNTVRTYTVEDEFPTIKESHFCRGMQSGSFNLSVVAGQQIVTGAFTGRGSTIGLMQRQTVTGSSDVSFAGAVITVGPGVPSSPTPAAGDFVLVTGSANNDGYYEITNVAGNDVTVNGTLTTESNTSAVLEFTGQTQFVSTSGTGGTRGTAERIRSGNSVNLELSDDNGSTWYPLRDYGIRVQQADLAITAALEDQEEITEDNPFISTLQDKTVELTLTFHVINLDPRRFLDAKTELDMRLSLLNSSGNGYRFRMPRAKSSGASPGEAAKGQSMTGEWTLQGLLTAANNRDLEIEKV